VTGAGGLIGNYLVQTAPQFAPDVAVVGLTRAQLDLSDFAAVRGAFRKQTPRAVIHCAALSRTAECESNPALAHRLNVEVTAVLAELAAEIPFVFLSSDLVFDGRRGRYTEDEPVNPLMVYAETKVAAERIVLANPRHMVMRTSLNGGISPTHDRGFNELLWNAWRAGQSVRLFTDEFRSPIPAEATARAIWELIESNHAGIYHIAGADRLSRWDIGRLLAARCPQMNPKMEPASLHDFRGAPRPPDTSLDCAKAQQLLSFPLPRFSECLKTFEPNPAT